MPTSPLSPPLSLSAPLSRSTTAQQTRQDLEALFNSVNKGWSCFGGTPTFVYGQGGGCLHQQICKIAQDWPRRNAMMNALGFGRAVEMFHWNDTVATWDSVKELVKDAIGKL